MPGMIIIATFFIFCACAGGARAQEARSAIGMIKSVSGEAFVVRDGHRVAAVAGLDLYRGDRVTTGGNGSAGILLKDDTALSLGPATEASLEHFAFDPAEKRLGMVLRVARGIFGYLSGKIAKLAPGSVRIETPVATLGVRGTYFVARIVP